MYIAYHCLGRSSAVLPRLHDLSMDSCPNVTELLHNVRLYRNKINKLAKHLEISVEDNIKGKDRLEVVFKKWIDRKGDEATRRNMLKSLVDIKEREIADTYHKHITTIKECKPVIQIIIFTESLSEVTV